MPIYTDDRPMSLEEFEAIRVELDLSKTEVGQALGVGYHTIKQYYAKGEIPTRTAIQLRQYRALCLVRQAVREAES